MVEVQGVVKATHPPKSKPPDLARDMVGDVADPGPGQWEIESVRHIHAAAFAMVRIPVNPAVTRTAGKAPKPKRSRRWSRSRRCRRSDRPGWTQESETTSPP